MNTRIYKKVMLVFGLAGVLFSGYLSAVKIFTDVCAFNEPCPFFLGYPACWYGFGMFLVIFLAAVASLLELVSTKVELSTIWFVSFLGILFAGYFTLPEINNMLAGTQTNYTLGLPTCAYGLVFYVLIFITSLIFYRSSGDVI